MMLEAYIANKKVQIIKANPLQQYVADCINHAIQRIENYPPLAKEENIPEYVIKKITGYDEPFDAGMVPLPKMGKRQSRRHQNRNTVYHRILRRLPRNRRIHGKQYRQIRFLRDDIQRQL